MTNVVFLNLLFITYRLRILRRFFQIKPLAKMVTALLFTFVFIGFGFGVFFFTQKGFLLFQSDAFLYQAMTLYVLELFFLMVIYFILISTLISGVFGLFRSRQDSWLVTSPGFVSLPWWYYLRIFVSSLWPFLLLATPGLVAIKSVFSLTDWQFFLSLIAVVILVGVVVSLTMSVLFTSAQILYRLRSLSLKRLTLALMVIFGLASCLVWQQALPKDLFNLFGVYDFAAPSAAINPVIDRFRLFPSHLLAMVIYSFQFGNSGLALVNFSVLVLLAIVAQLLLLRTFNWFLPIWQILQEGSFEAREQTSEISLPAVAFPRFFQSQVGAIFAKEAILILRNLRSLSWLGFLITLWLIVTSFNFLFKTSLARYQLSSSILPDLVFALQILILIYFVSAIVLRFVFPSFSMERRTAWIIGSAPVELVKVFYGKLSFFVTFFVLLALVISLVNSWFFSGSLVDKGVFMFLVSLAVVFVTVLGLALGAIFPNFETDDPEALSTSLPGLTLVLGSVLYGGLGSAGYYLYLSRRGILLVGLFVFISFLGLSLFLKLTPHFLKKIEFESKPYYA